MHTYDAVNVHDLLDNLEPSFDSNWYKSTYRDVSLNRIDPRTHYIRYGFRLGRGISEKYPTIESIPQIQRALSRTPMISYCIPVMNRADDIRGTLEKNLEQNAPYSSECEFIVTFFDQDTETHDWIRSTFKDEMGEGYLRLILSDVLDTWHFGKAKNIFRNHAIGEVYSSLDGDNFVTRAETAQLLDIAYSYPNGFIFHHFSGSWGDGSSGRISMPMWLYRQVGYDNTLLPRQFDEIDAILSGLSYAPDIPFISYANLETPSLSSKRTSEFITDAVIDNDTLTVPPVQRMSPLNPKMPSYVASDPQLETMQNFNQAVSFQKNAPTQKMRKKYLDLTARARWSLIDKWDAKKLLDTLFYCKDVRKLDGLKVDSLCAFACMKDDNNFLDSFFDHYTRLGVDHFFIVDDRSSEPISKHFSADNIHIVRPKVGRFLTSKSLWIESLIKAFVLPGSWALTVDADEFIDIPPNFNGFPDLTASLELSGFNYAPSLLIDMLPNKTLPFSNPEKIARQFLKYFDRHLDLKTTPSEEYSKHHSIDWGFGKHAWRSWAIDTRYHAFNTFDSLRKIPLFQYSPMQHLNQGFHSLHFTDDRTPPGHEMWERDIILPIRHYKLTKLFTEAVAKQSAEQIEMASGAAYHQRTAQNIAKIFSLSPEDAMARLLALPTVAYSEGRFTRQTAHASA